MAQLRQRWPGVKIVLRADSGFCREQLMAWCEKDEIKVDYVFGLACNKRLRRIIDRDDASGSGFAPQHMESCPRLH